MSEHSESLQDATAQLYLAFAGYGEETLSTAWEKQLAGFDILATTPLSQLSVTDLSPFIQNFAIYDDSGQILRRFLPRILELCIDGYHRWAMPLKSIFEALNFADWQFWSVLERRSIENFLRALWLHHLHDVSPAGTISSINTLLEAIASVMDIQPFLDVWLDIPERNATAHIASLTVYGNKNAYDMRHWLSQAETLQRIEAAFWDCGDTERAAMFAKAAEYLRLDESLMPA